MFVLGLVLRGVCGRLHECEPISAIQLSPGFEQLGAEAVPQRERERERERGLPRRTAVEFFMSLNEQSVWTDSYSEHEREGTSTRNMDAPC
jgi:hypothetical protein